MLQSAVQHTGGCSSTPPCRTLPFLTSPTLPLRTPRFPQSDRSGTVSVERLGRTLREFELHVDLETLLEEHDLEETDGLTFEQFRTLLEG